MVGLVGQSKSAVTSAQWHRQICIIRLVMANSAVYIRLAMIATVMITVGVVNSQWFRPQPQPCRAAFMEWQARRALC